MSKKLASLATRSNHLEWLKVREVVMEVKNEKVDKVKEKLLKSNKALQEFFYKAIRIKHKQSMINMIKMDKSNG